VRPFQQLALILTLSLCGWAQQAPSTNQKHQADKSQAATVVYRNREYGFSFTLPASWKGYTVVWSEWSGSPVTTNGRPEHLLRGPQVLIRHPKWTQENPREDLPLMIYTIAQWNESPVVSAAPYYPWEFGRNSKYVFAVPPRWDNDSSEGVEEAEKIMGSKPFHTFSPAK
jgi:hypothetical protein